MTPEHNETTATGAPVDGRLVLEVSGVSKSFGGVAALRDVSFDLNAGEVHALVGENGAGKSTLIKVITGVYQADRGTVEYQGQQVRFARPLEAQNAGISTIYQEINLVPLMSVARNIFLNREPRNRCSLVDAATMNSEATRLLAEVGIRVDVRRPLRSLSTGMQQMVAIARAISTDARVVIMDEPTSSLELREVGVLFDVVRRLTERGIGVLYVSHKLDELYQICRRVTVLRDGRRVHTGPLAELSRLQLVSHMLGREISQVQREGLTAFDSDGGSTGEPPAPMLRARDLNRRHVLQDVSFQVAPGEVLGLGGLLGAGRSETVRAVAGSLALDSGSVDIDGRAARVRSPHAGIRLGISLLTEDRKADGIVPSLSVRENIVLAAMPKLSRWGIVSERRQRAVVDTFTRRLRIKAAGQEQPVGELSGGNQQKVLLARWLCLAPKILLLDEPTRGIDVGAKAEVQSLVAELAAEGLAVVLISSEMEELIEGSDRIVALKDGMTIGELRGPEKDEQKLMAMLSGTPTQAPPVAGADADPVAGRNAGAPGTP